MIQAFTLAASAGDVDGVRRLVAYCADFDYCKSSALSAAIMYGRVKVVQYLVGLGVDIRDGDGFYVRMAVQYGQAAIVKLLIELGGVIDGNYLMQAVLGSHEAVVRVLVSHGVGASNKNIAQMALVPGCTAILRELSRATPPAALLRLAARRLYSAVLATWVPRCYDRRRRAGRRMGRRNFAAFRRICEK